MLFFIHFLLYIFIIPNVKIQAQTVDNCIMGVCANCTKLCNCVGQVAHNCNENKQFCSSCSSGFMIPPCCETSCPIGRFGPNCAFECHCKPTATCQKNNGHCSDDDCDPEWYGAGCQKRLPKLMIPPDVYNLNCTFYTISWKGWNQIDDIGIPPVSSYILQERIFNYSWANIQRFIHYDSNIAANYSKHFNGRIQDISYQYRVITFYKDSDKELDRGLPSPIRTVQVPKCYIATTTILITSTSSLITSTTPTSTTTTTPITTTTATSSGGSSSGIGRSSSSTSAPNTISTASLTTQITRSSTTLEPKVPSKISNLTVIVDQSGFVIVIWQTPISTNNLNLLPITYSLTYQPIRILSCPIGYNFITSPPPVTNIIADKSFKILENDLRIYTEYELRIFARNQIGNGNVTIKKFQTVPKAPVKAPNSINILQIDTHYAILEWDVLSCQDYNGMFLGYELNVFEESSNKLSFRQIIPANRTNVTDLIALRTYRANVAFVNAWTKGPPSANFQFTTLEDRPSPVTNLATFVANDGRVSVSWKSPGSVNRPINGFSLTYKKIRYGNCIDSNLVINSTITKILYDGLTTSVILSTLDGWSTYLITVAAINAFGSGDERSINVLTPEIIPIGKVGNLRAISESRKIRIEWDTVKCNESNGILLRYDLVITSTSAIHRDSTTQQFYELTSTFIKPYSDYAYKVAFVNKAGIGPWMESLQTIKTKSDLPTSPQNGEVTTVRNTSLLIRWKPPITENGPITGYKISWSPTNGNVAVFNKEVNANILETNLTALEPYTEYSIDIRAATSAGFGQPTSTIKIRTAEGIPSAPVDLKRTNRNETCLIFEWSKPLRIPGILGDYIITVTVLNSYASLDLQNKAYVISSKESRYELCNLMYATQYRIQISATTVSGGTGSQTHLESWTELAKPPNPSSPEFITSTNSTITVRLLPISITTGPVSNYYLQLNDDTYISLAPNSLQVAKSLVLGESKSLTAQTTYNISLVIESILDGLTKSATSSNLVAKTKATTSTTTATEQSVVAAPSTKISDDLFWILVLAVPLGALILILLLILCIVCLCCRRGRGGRSCCCCCISKSDLSDEGKLVPEVNKPASWLVKYENEFLRTNQTAKKVSNADDDFNLPIFWTDKFRVEERRRIRREEIVPLNGSLTFKGEWHLLPFERKDSCKVASRKSNAFLNRFPLFLPYDRNRVVLNLDFNAIISSERKSTFDSIRLFFKPKPSTYKDYYNASYIFGYDQQDNDEYPRFICAQSPHTDKTVDDFWRMIVQEKITVIVMMEKLQDSKAMKCTQYWPSVDYAQFCENFIQVEAVSIDIYSYYVCRTFRVQCKCLNYETYLKQYQYLSWPTHGVPEDAVPFYELVRRIKNEDDHPHSIKDVVSRRPILVHCATAVSRSATFIAVDSAWRQYERDGNLNLMQIVDDLRQQRPFMIRTLNQYRFIYDTIFEAFIAFSGGIQLRPGDILFEWNRPKMKHLYKLLTSTDANNCNEEEQQHGNYNKCVMRQQFEILEKITRRIEGDHLTANLAVNRSKNRFVSIIPRDHHRPKLPIDIITSSNKISNDYINAVYLDNHRKRGAIIITQTPLNCTAIDFWRLIADKSINIIVSMNDIEEENNETTCCQYWPRTLGEQRIFNDQLIVSLFETTDDHSSNTVSIDHLKLCYNDKETIVKRFQLKDWKLYDKTPNRIDNMYRIVDFLNSYWKENNDKTILIECMDGATRSGFLATLLILYQQMTIDARTSIFHTVRSLKKRRPHIINTFQQYKFLYKFLWHVINSNLPTATDA